MSQHYGFDLDTPFQALSEPVQQAILHGSGDEQIEFSYLDSRGRPTTRRHPFEGVVPNIQRRYRETQSNVVREELGKYLGTVTAPTAAAAACAPRHATCSSRG